MENVDLENKTFSVVEQLPFALPAGTTYVENMAPVKSSKRTLPITALTLPYFIRQKERQKEQKCLLKMTSEPYYDNDLYLPSRMEFRSVGSESLRTSDSFSGTMDSGTFVFMIFATRMSSTRQKFLAYA